MTEQCKLRLEADVIRRLDAVARKYHRRSANEVGAEVSAQYLDFGEYAEAAKHTALAEQRAALTERVPVIEARKAARKGGKKPS